MFRITHAEEPDARVLRLEGSLSSAQLPVLDAALAEVPGSRLQLDLAGLRWLDAPAAERLRALHASGVALRAASPFVERLLAADAR